MAEARPSVVPWTAHARSLLSGTAEGTSIVLDEPLSLWGGLDPETGTITEARHPQHGRSIAGGVLVMPFGRGSSSSSTILAEALRAGAGPVAIVLQEADEILLVGALVIQLLDKRTMPVVVLEADTYRRIEDGAHLAIAPEGTVTVTPRSTPVTRHVNRSPSGK